MHFKNHDLFWTKVDEDTPPEKKSLFVWAKFGAGPFSPEAPGFPAVATYYDDAKKGAGWRFEDPDLQGGGVIISHWKTANAPEHETVLADILNVLAELCHVLDGALDRFVDSDD